MCGIVGWVSWAFPPDLDVVKKMNAQLIHRGPDAGEVYTAGPIALGHRRLSIIDLHKSANQPMFSLCKRFIIVFNGEIYNFKILKKELEYCGAKFITNGDTEVILEAFRIWGHSCIKRLEGMFSFAIWDSLKQELFLARDRLGEKPLYYSVCNGKGLIFASELQALRSNPSISTEIDLNAFGQYLTLNYVTGHQSMIQGVSKLLPGHYLVYSQVGGIKIDSYWDLAEHFNAKKSTQSAGTAALQLQLLLDNSVKARMVSDVPIGAFLSGGIDSSSIVAAMVKGAESKLVNTFCIGFKEKGYSEANEARKIASHLNTSHHEYIVGENIDQDFKKIICSMDEPVADTSFIPFYYLAKFSRQFVKVALSGDGGDEILAGYETYSADRLTNILKSVPNLVWNISEKIVTNFMPVSHGKVSFDFKLRQFIRGQTLNADQAHLFWRTIFTESEKYNLVNPDIAKQLKNMNPFEYHFSKLEEVREAHYLDRAMYLDLKTWLPDDILTKVDRATMAHSLESRAPFLDSKLVEFCAELPIKYKLNGLNKKYLLKKSQIDRLPKATLKQKKKGFNAPLSKWMEEEVKTSMIGATANKKMSAFFNSEKVAKLWEEHENLKKDNSYKLFGLTCFSIWLENSH
jgi:asparagine synthase (glutamine-hydrolysing)